MRVLVLFAHPLADSFAAALHRAVVAKLRQGGHEVDDCDLYAEGFDPVLSAAERRAYNTPSPGFVGGRRACRTAAGRRRAGAVLSDLVVRHAGDPERVFRPGLGQ